MELRLGPLTLTRMVEMNADRETSAPLGCLVHDRQMIARLDQSELKQAPKTQNVLFEEVFVEYIVEYGKSRDTVERENQEGWRGQGDAVHRVMELAPAKRAGRPKLA